MMTPTLTTQVFFEAWGFTLVHFCWQATVLAGLYKLLDVSLTKLKPQARYMLGLTTLIGMAAIAAATFAYEFVRLLPDAVAPASRQIAAQLPALLPVLSPDTRLTLSKALPYLDAAWLLGVIGLSLRTLGGFYFIHRLKKAAVPVPEALSNRFGWVLRRMGLQGKVRLRLHPGITGPFVIGAFRSVIYLPVSAITALSPDQLDAVLAHELEHIRRADYAWNLVQSLIETVFFFHPAVWWLGARLRDQRELCCDDAALKACDDPLTYATALLSLEEQRRLSVRPPQASLVMALNGQGDAKGLLGRIARILGETKSLPRTKARPHLAIALPVVLLMLAAFITPVAQVAARVAVAANAAAPDETPAPQIDLVDDQQDESHTLPAANKKPWTFASNDGEWQAEFDSIDPDAIARQVRADLLAAKADVQANAIDADAIAAEVRADLQRAKADMEARGLANTIDPDAEAARARADALKAKAEMARLDSIDVDAMAEKARADAQRAKEDLERHHRNVSMTAPEADYDETPALLADPDVSPPAQPAPPSPSTLPAPPTPVAAPAPPAAPSLSTLPPPPPVPAKPAKVKVKVTTHVGQITTITLTGPVASVSPAPHATELMAPAPIITISGRS